MIDELLLGATILMEQLFILRLLDFQDVKLIIEEFSRIHSFERGDKGGVLGCGPSFQLIAESRAELLAALEQKHL